MVHHEEALLFSSTATYCKMQLSDSSKATTLPLDPTDKSKTERLALACRSTSKELQQRLSIASDTSDPGLDDPFASSTSDSSSEDHDDDSEGEALEQAAAHLWDSWWSPAKQNLEMRQSFYQVTPRSTVNITPEPLSPCNRNFASENLSDLTLSNEPLSKLHRSSAIRNAKHQSRSQTPPTRQSQHAYTTFPTQPPPVPPKPQNYRPHGRYKSWPTRSSSRQMSRPPLQRTRANTTPGNPYAPVHSSGLSIITTLSPTPQGSRQTSWSTTSEDRLYMRSSLNTPPTRPLMDLMSNEICPEISCFEDDDDDEKLGLIDSLGSKLHIRTSCGGAARDKVFDVEEKKRSSKIRSRARSATGAIRDVFVRKRAGTVGCS
ncbi:hypothetical protein GLAREA_11734 [Glarea lozoyensis ATCC 20868]|uniref:Uncharacterized protein n=1 Tax=Glarea lozoyensis (strain ATCC 20868 / MF5171) TaxID=1116229 RepID=S3DES1_GLAL2|nr:uncharacterized protein GLAREA_11734 [Glarea lozoyensis ATCC 20868]EPE25153.1 hypothetical protein GLAREA_11734 [Glarea lozoyensis ATCC 20868]